MKSTHIETVAIHGSMRAQKAENSPIVPGIELSTIYEHAKDGHREGDLKYSRLENPNRLELEAVLNDLEKGAEAAAFSSGIAAINAVFQTLSHGDHVLIPNDVYFGTRKLMWEFSERWGLEIDFVDMTNLEVVEAAAKKNTRMIWIETPSNPQMFITDVEAMVKWAADRKVVVAVDNTWPTPFNMNPIDFGVDLVIHSTTKYLGGHSDLIGGAVIAKESGPLMDRVRSVQVVQGGVPSPFDAWMLCRSIRSFPYRMRAHNENASQLATFMTRLPGIEEVFYPGLVSHPGHKIAKTQMRAFGGMISFLVSDGEPAAKKMVASSRIIKAATSLGGIESIWEHRKSTEGPLSQTPDNLIRLSVGLEHIDDLKLDLQQALELSLTI
ncbi:aminotransferase class I/II-fold pyridoxal phosphate-dependent enzyme [Bacteroidota bacterium]|jgi:cystathionine gamma-synthase|nr:aminotransferase class I/II-fold pyridoxal phosphate-dependent enzyme [Balneolaceae bacterium]MDC3136433.1 aminotransferase class I/II-fold pyridoxal phosphate-dependent enzyme [Bacteroidota bacterium]PDH56217.1 MAG: cystathionine gamma-synthase [Rhodothermaeota bacterium MED-G12]CAI8378525.1 MAG: Cystathionine gamma-synthase [Rhodothermaeota bacterium MED-G12]